MERSALQAQIVELVGRRYAAAADQARSIAGTGTRCERRRAKLARRVAKAMLRSGALRVRRARRVRLGRPLRLLLVPRMAMGMAPASSRRIRGLLDRLT